MSTQFNSQQVWESASDVYWKILVNTTYDYERTTTGMRWRFYISMALDSGTMTIPIKLRLAIADSVEVSSYYSNPDIEDVTIKARNQSWSGGITYDTGWITKEGEYSSDTVYCYMGLETDPVGLQEWNQWSQALYNSGYINSYSNKSKITFYGYPIIGQTHRFDITAANSAYSHKVIFTLNEYSQQISLSSGSLVTNGSWVPNVAGFAAESPDSNRPLIDYTVETYYGGVKIGYIEGQIYLNVVNIPPSTVISVSDVSGHLQTYGYYLLGYSEIGISLASSAQYDAVIDSEIVYVGTEQLVPPDNIVIPTTFNGTIQAVVTDSRTATGSAQSSIVTRAYNPPNVATDQDNVAQFSVHRVDSHGNADDTGEYCRVDFEVVYDLLNAAGSQVGRNSHRLIIEWESNSDSISGSHEVTVSSYDFTGSYTFAADIEHSFTVTLVMIDDIRTISNPVERSIQLSTAQVIMDWKVGGKGVGIGKVAEHNNALDINPDWDVNMGDLSHLKFNGVALDKAADTVIKEGLTGIWHYKFWKNGNAELDGVADFSLTTSVNLAGWYVYQYYQYFSNAQAFPVFHYDEIIDGAAVEAYIVGTTQSGSRQNSDWLSDEAGGSALTPETGELYIIKTAGTYYETVWTWKGSFYEEYTRNMFVDNPACVASVYDDNYDGNPVPALLVALGKPSYVATQNFIIATSQAVTGRSYHVAFHASGKWKT